jgi:hypothetical protein
MVVRVDGTIASRRGAAARFGCAPTACGEVALGAGTLAEVGRTSAVLGEAPAALDTDVVVLSGVAAAGCPPLAVGVGGIVDTSAESTVGAGLAVASDDGVGAMGDSVGAMEVESGAPVRSVGGSGDACEPPTRG